MSDRWMMDEEESEEKTRALLEMKGLSPQEIELEVKRLRQLAAKNRDLTDEEVAAVNEWLRKDALSNIYKHAMRAIKEALQEMESLEPKREYFDGEGRFALAMEQHSARVDALQRVYDEYEDDLEQGGHAMSWTKDISCSNCGCKLETYCGCKLETYLEVTAPNGSVTNYCDQVCRDEYVRESNYQTKRRDDGNLSAV